MGIKFRFFREGSVMKSITKKEVELLLIDYTQLEFLKCRLIESLEILIKSYNTGGKLLVCGNGGSAADSMHIVGELMKSFALPRRVNNEISKKIKDLYPEYYDYYTENLQSALPAISLVSEIGLTTAYANDNSSDLVFAQQVMGHGNANDVLIAISTSGNSTNVLHAARMAKIKGLKVISLTGMGGGKLAEYSDILLDTPSNITYKIQEMHLPIYHTLCLALEKEFFWDGE